MHISVIIPSFNRSHTLGRALDSVMAQSFPAAEVIVVDDGSSDATRELVLRYPRVDYLGLEVNRGVSFARNTGIRNSTGEWVALLDSDDAWTADKLEKQASAIHAFPEYRVFHSDEIWIRNGRRVNAMRKHAKPDGWVYEHSLPLCCVSPSSVLLHRSLFRQCGDFDENLPACEDYDLWLRLFSRYPVKLIDEPLVIKYGGHPDQLSRQHWGMDRFRVVALQKMLDSGFLDEAQRAKTRKTLEAKCSVLIKGAEKRGHIDRANFYREIVDRYSSGSR